MNCPTCNHDTLDPGLSVNVEAEEMVFMGNRRALTKSQAEILAAMLKRFAHVTRYTAIEALLWGNDIDGGPATARDVIKVQMCHIRRKMRGWPFKILCHQGEGYSLCRAETVVTDGGFRKALKEVA